MPLWPHCAYFILILFVQNLFMRTNFICIMLTWQPLTTWVYYRVIQSLFGEFDIHTSNHDNMVQLFLLNGEGLYHLLHKRKEKRINKKFITSYLKVRELTFDLCCIELRYTDFPRTMKWKLPYLY